MGYNLCACGNRKRYTAGQCRVCRYSLIEEPRREIPAAEVAWTAGILEGEGCWTGGPNRQGRWVVAVRMTDEDIIERLHEVTGVGRITVEESSCGYKTAWIWQVAARPHREWLTLKVWPWLGTRRRARIRELRPEVDLALQAFSGDVPALQAG